MKKSDLFPLVFVDVALFSIVSDCLRVLLVRRAQDPNRRGWALPGGILKPEMDADLKSAATRVLRTKISVEVPHLEEVRTFSGVDRDPRGWSISVLFCALLPYDKVNALVKDKVEALEWAAADNPGHRMAFDHGEQLAVALHVLRDRVRVTRPVLPLHLMPERFTLTALQKTCEAILGKEIDKAAFRRRLKDSTDLVELPGELQRGSHAPAQLFRARDGFEFAV